MKKIEKFIIKSMNIDQLLFNILTLLYMTFTLSFSENSVIHIIMLLFVFIVYLIRIFKRFKVLKGLLLIDFNNLNFGKDSKERSNQLLDICWLIFIIVYTVTLISGFGIDVFNAILYTNTGGGIIFTTVFFYIISVYFSIAKNKFYLKSFSILLTTIQGLILGFYLLFVVLLPMGYLMKLLTYSNSIGPISSTKIIEPTIIEPTIILLAPIIINMSLSFVIMIGIGSLIFQILNLYLTPPYQLKVLENGYKALNIFIAVVGILALLYSPTLYKSVEGFKNDVIYEMNNYQSSEMNSDEKDVFINELTKVNENSYTRMIAILFAPYTIGALLISFLLSYRMNRCEKKASQLVSNFLENNELICLFALNQIAYLSSDKHVLTINLIKKITSPNTVSPSLRDGDT